MSEEKYLKMDLTIKIADIPAEGRELELDVPAEPAAARLANAVGEEFNLSAPIRGRLRLEKAGVKIVLKGRVATTLRLACDRCLEEFDHETDEEILVVFTPAPTERLREEELNAESLSQEIFTGEEIDLWPVVAEHIMLGLPVKAVCREDCSGICRKCGQDLNNGVCGCEVESGNSKMAALAAIRNQLPKE